jgi:hypothetical protein
MSISKLSKRIIELKEKKYNFTPDKCPEEITFEMLMEEIEPEEKYQNTDKGKNTLWNTYYSVCLSPNQFGFYINKNEIDINKNKFEIPWYKLTK